MHAKYEVSTSNGSKVIVNVKVDNRQTDRQTNRQDKNNMPPIIRSGGIKSDPLVASFCAICNAMCSRHKYCKLIKQAKSGYMQFMHVIIAVTDTTHATILYKKRASIGFLFSHSSDKGFCFWNFSMNTARKNLKLAQNFKLVLS